MTTSIVNIMPGIFAQGAITSGTPIVIPMTHASIPSTVVVDTVAAGKLIEISVDGGTLYYTATLTTGHANQIIAVITYAVTHVRVTGQNGDSYKIL
jgi:hypothetical protein